MAIKGATEIIWNPIPRCPVCGAGITPSGRNMPFAVDENGKVYCRDHGDSVESAYPAKLAEYQQWRRRRAEALTSLEEEARRHAPQRKTGTDGSE